MTLYPNNPFSDGDIFTGDLATLSFNQVYDDQNYLGHHPRLLDDSLSNSAGQVKSRLSLVTDNLKVSVVSGLTVAYLAGKVRLPNGDLMTIGSGTLLCTDNATAYVYVNQVGTVAVGSPTVVRTLLAKVVAAGGVITLTDLRAGAGIPDILPVSASVRNFGGRGDEGNKVCVANEVLDLGEYYFNDFTVPSGISITIDKIAKIYCAGNVLINGTITVPPFVSGGGGTAYFVPPNGLSGGEGGAGFGGGSGETPKGIYSHTVSPVGSGGGAPYFMNTGTGTIITNNLGGKGGGCLWIEAAGTVTINGTILAKGENGADGFITGTLYMSGAGAGSGGLILLRSLSSVTVSATAILNVSGGAGGLGVKTSGGAVTCEPGSGGGGGRINLSAPVVNTTGATLTLSGGAVGGQTVNAAVAGTAIGGTGGSFGGLGGHQQPFAAGNIGLLTTRLFVPIG